ncbi:hypothetical protein ACVME8_002735 [Bradyrhizobium diazoefficiens]
MRCPLRRRSSSKRALTAPAVFQSNLARMYFAHQESASDLTSKRLVPWRSRVQENLNPAKRNRTNPSPRPPSRSKHRPVPAVQASRWVGPNNCSLSLERRCFKLHARAERSRSAEAMAAALIAAPIKLAVSGVVTRPAPKAAANAEEAPRQTFRDRLDLHPWAVGSSVPAFAKMRSAVRRSSTSSISYHLRSSHLTAASSRPRVSTR